MSHKNRLAELRRWRDRIEGKINHINRGIGIDEGRATKYELSVSRLDKAIELLQAAVEARREELRQKVENLVTKGLRAVFERPDFEFYFNVQIQRGRTGIIPMLRSRFDGRIIETGIVDGHGGGVADVVSFILRVIVMSMLRPAVAPVLVMDETFRHVSTEYLPRVATLLQELSNSAGVQFILITHKKELLDAADTVYRAELSEEGSTGFKLEHRLRDESYHAAPPRRGPERLKEPEMTLGQLRKSPPKTRRVLSKTTDAAARRSRNPERIRENRQRFAAAKAKRKAERRAKK